MIGTGGEGQTNWGQVMITVKRREQRSGMFGLEQLEARQLLAFDPTPSEQYLLELTNRFRIDPASELGLLTTSLGTPARSSDGNVDSALRFFNTSGPLLASQWLSLSPAQPLAWNEDLYEAAEFHNNAMIAADVQEHQVSGEPDLGARANAAGFTGWSRLGESIFAFARSVIHTHAGFLLDWGNTPTGIQQPPGHRESAINPNFRETGIRILTPGLRAGKDTGPWVVTQDFGSRFAQTQAFVLGVAFGDSNNDGFYSEGEGLGGVTVIVEGSGGRFQTTTMSAGGWQVTAPPGTYNVTYVGAGFGASATFVGVEVGTQNVKVDGKRGVRPPVPEIEVVGNGVVIADGDTTPTSQDFSGFGFANLTLQSITRTFVLRNTGTQTLSLSSLGLRRVVISGSGAADFRLVQDVPTSVLPGQSAEFVITFDPSVLGKRQATVTIVSNDVDEGTYTFSIQGNGVRRAIAEVSGNGQVIENGDATPRALDGTAYGQVNFTGGERVKSFVITNIGLGTMNVSASVVAQNGFAGDELAYSVLSLSASSLLPGQSATLRVRYVPTRSGAQAAVVRVVTNDPTNLAYDFAVRASGRAVGRVGVFSNGRQILNGATQTSVLDRTSFASVDVVGASRTRVYAIRNIGQSVLALSGTARVIISGADAAAFSVIAQPARASLTVGQNSTFKVRFDPSGFGLMMAVVTIMTNDTFARSFSFTISGVGV